MRVLPKTNCTCFSIFFVLGKIYCGSAVNMGHLRGKDFPRSVQFPKCPIHFYLIPPMQWCQNGYHGILWERAVAKVFSGSPKHHWDTKLDLLGSSSGIANTSLKSACIMLLNDGS